MNSKLFYGAALMTLLTAAPAFAQSATDDIIVTATKRATTLQNTAVAVTPVSEEKLKSLNVVSIGDLTRIAPSLNFIPAPSNATTMFVVRGVSTFAFNDALEQSVGLVLDGVPVSRLVGSVNDMVDVGQVQVLRGPQGTLFGKNATAGVISVDTRDPNFGATTMDARLVYGSYDEKRVQTTVNMGGENAALRVSAWKMSRDGYIRAPNQPDGDIGGFDNKGVRVKAAFAPTADWRIDLGYETRNDTNDGSIQTVRGRVVNRAIYSGTPANAPISALNGGATGLEAAITDIDRANGMVEGPDNQTTFKRYPENSTAKQDRLTLKSVNSVGDLDFTAILGYIDTHQAQMQSTDYTDYAYVGTACAAFNFSQCIAQPGQSVYYSNILQRTAEFRVSNSDKSALKYVAGLFYYDTNVSTGTDAESPLQNNPVGGAAVLRTAQWSRLLETTDTAAAFADVTYTIGKAEAFVGGRYSHERSVATLNRTPTAIFGNVPQPTGATQNFLSVRALPITTNDFSWRGGVQYHVTDEVMLYASANRAYKGAGFNFGPTLTAVQFANNGGIVNKEVAKSYEVGARSRWFDRQLTLNVTGFYSPFTNFQVTAVLPTNPTSFASVNAPELLAQGIETEFNFSPNAFKDFSLDGSVVWNDTHYKDFKYAPCYTGQVNTGTLAVSPGAGACYTIAAGQVNAGAAVQDVSGLRAVGSPEWQVNLTPALSHDYENFRAFTSLHYLYTSDVQFGVNKNPDSIQKAYSTVDLTAGFGALNKNWTVTFYGRNLTDERYVTRISVANPTLNQSIPFQAFRTAGVALDLSF
jgi:iron complex outermembrane receptor protein